MIPGSGRSSGEGIGYELQYSWASLIAQLVKNPAMRETWVLIHELGRSPGEGKGCPVQCSGLENSMDCIVLGATKSQTRLSGFHFHKVLTHSVVSDSLWPHGLQLARFLCPWNFTKKNNGVFQARIISSSRIPSRPRDLICISCILHWQVDSLQLGPPGKPRI